MPKVSHEYAELRTRLDEWFATQTNQQRIIAGGARQESGTTSLWEVHAGFIGDLSLSCSGLAIVLRKGLAVNSGIYRVDVYEPDDQWRLPPAHEMAGRIEYAPATAGFTYSKNPDAAPTETLYEPQFRTMHYLLDLLRCDLADPAAVTAWAQTYELSSAASTTEEPFLTLLRGQLAETTIYGSDQQAA